MLSSLPQTAQEFKDWSWSQIDPYFADLLKRPMTEANLNDWLLDWSQLGKLLDEAYWRLYVAHTIDTTDQDAERRYTVFLDEIRPRAKSKEQKLKEKFLASGFSPPDFDVPLRNMRAQANMFREANQPLLSQELKLSSEYDKIIGAQTVQWEGQEVTLLQLQPVYQEIDRDRRERAWHLAAERQLADREVINGLWANFLSVRRQLAINTELLDYRAFRWIELLRFDYTPEDCFQFHQAIEEVVVPVAKIIYEKRRRRLGVKTLRPWDLEVDPLGKPPLRPFSTIEELESKVATMFQSVDPHFGEYFETMRREGLLDLDNHMGKAPGGYCTIFAATQRPFISMNAVGIHDDVQTLLHEGGHAFHDFERSHLLFHHLEIPLEFAEVASMSMELLAAPYLAKDGGGFYNPEDAARARVEHLERSLLFWPYMAVVDAFQHWIYENHDAASDPANCDAKWVEIWERFMPGVDWSGLEQERMTGWQRKPHIHDSPFYYVEYGLAQLGAVQVWRNSLNDRASAIAAYRMPLSLGGSAPLPHLFSTAGARFTFDAGTLSMSVDLMQKTITDLEASL
ncbi:MAG: M3 family oligoendopeptidase [Chloroflexi bacterium RBG_19FT_COMBO_55_16]|nr:MAG: M3 family oligoendopeptidase [Chloroflexi bacterium RBG_19FT_COMBO_55_16]